MRKLFVEKNIEINAAPERVWQALTDKEFTKHWISHFGMDGWLDSDWNMNSAVEWKDASGKVCVTGNITDIEPNRRVHFTVFDVGWERPENVDEKTDGITYMLSEHDGRTLLSVSQGDFGKIEDGQKYHDLTAQVWDKVLPTVKDLAEKVEQLHQEGFTNLRICPLPPMDAPEHTHDEHTVYLVLSGELTITQDGETKTYRTGEKIEFPAGTTHKAQSKGGSMINGEKKRRIMKKFL